MYIPIFKHYFMRLLIILFFSFSSYYSYSQKLPLIQANSDQAIIIEKGEIITPWTLSPQVKWDTYETGKNIDSRTVRFKTDLSDTTFTLKAGDTINFGVVLQGNDTCWTRIISPSLITDLPFANHNLPFRFNDYNNILFKTIVNQKDTFDFMFDSGAFGFYMLKPNIRKLFAKGDEPVLFSDVSNVHFQIGDMHWPKNKSMVSISLDKKLEVCLVRIFLMEKS